MRYFVAVFVLLMPIMAHGATCPAGQYLNNGECTDCNTSTEPVYCPGDDMIYNCPKTNTDYNALAYPNVVNDVIEASWTYPPGSSVYSCISDIFYDTPDGDRYLIECPFNGVNYYCDNYPKYWFIAGVGRYLSGYYCNGVDYHTTKPCTNAPDNAHYTGPGTPDDPVESGGHTDYNDCPWACDDGYGRHNDECLPLCTAGATKFHVGEFVFNIYANKLTTPAINIDLGDGSVCYVPLVEGSGKGALNVDYHGVIYHTSD